MSSLDNLYWILGKEKHRRTLRLKKMLKYRKSGIKTLRFVLRLDNYNIITQVNATEHVSFTFLMSYFIHIWSRSSLIHFACIGVAPIQLVTPQGEQLQCRQNGSNLVEVWYLRTQNWNICLYLWKLYQPRCTESLLRTICILLAALSLSQAY